MKGPTHCINNNDEIWLGVNAFIFQVIELFMVLKLLSHSDDEIATVLIATILMVLMSELVTICLCLISLNSRKPLTVDVSYT